MKIGIRNLFIWMFLLISLAACRGGPTTNAPSVSATPSITPSPLPTRSFPVTPVGPTLSPTPVQTATATPKPISNTETKDTSILFVNETIPDGTQKQPGESFTKTWTIKNGGTGVWSSAYDLYLVSANPTNEHLGSPESIPLSQEVKPGEEIKISARLIAPEQDGLYSVLWQLRDEHGYFVFGSKLWVTIRVGQAPVTNAITTGNVTATLMGASQQGGETSVDFCMQLPDSRAWYPWDVVLVINQQQLSPSGSRIDPATATTPYKCFRFSYPVSESAASGTLYQLSINKVELPPEVNQAENCANARQVLMAAYPGLDFTCGGPGYWYTGLVLQPGMSAEQADRLIMDAMSSTIYGPWNLNGVIP
jgi:Ig-like domain from next to BRCA1 gene